METMEAYSRYGYDDAETVIDLLRFRLEARDLDPDHVKDGIILGSGLGTFTEDHLDKDALVVPFGEIFDHLGLPAASQKAPGHAHELLIGPLKGDTDARLVMAQRGREHPYEGVSTRRATFWLRVMQLLGVETLFDSNAVGILTPKTLPLPSLMLVKDHRDLANDDPLVGPHEPKFGNRFPHKGNLYPKRSRDLVKEVAQRLGLTTPEGILFRFKGPAYESAAEIYDLRNRLDGIWHNATEQPGETDYTGEPVGAVGMSSTYEHLVAQHASPIQDTSEEKFPNRAFGKGRVHLSVGTNYAAGLGPKSLGAFPTPAEVEHYAQQVQEAFGKLAREVILEMRKAA